MTNLVVLSGNLGKDPEERKTTTGTTVVSLSLATKDGYGDKEKTNWHYVTVFGKVAENCAKYLSKGSKVLVQGRIDYSNYEKNGATVYKTDIIADKVEFLDNKGDKSNTGEVLNATPSNEVMDDFLNDSVPF